MMNSFMEWVEENGLSLVFTTAAGDSFYVNREKGFGVIKKVNDYGAHSFFLTDIAEIRTYDDEHLVAEWNSMASWRTEERSTRYSTNEMYMKISFRTRPGVRLQIFRATRGNIDRNTLDHMNLYNYACQLTQILSAAASGMR